MKHNLNAQAIGTLMGVSVKIEADSARLIAEMNNPIAESDAFIQTLQ